MCSTANSLTSAELRQSVITGGREGRVATSEPELDVFGFQVLEMFAVVHAAAIGRLCILDQLQSAGTFMKVYEFTDIQS